jgi:nicotinamidase-related amidase
METIMPSLTLFPKSTALVLIDLQKGITSFPVEPHPFAVVVENATLLANQFRELNAPVFLVRVAFPAGPAALNLITDAGVCRRCDGEFQQNESRLCDRKHLSASRAST